MREDNQRQRRQRVGGCRSLQFGEAGIEVHPLEFGIVLEPGQVLLQGRSNAAHCSAVKAAWYRTFCSSWLASTRTNPAISSG